MGHDWIQLNQAFHNVQTYLLRITKLSQQPNCVLTWYRVCELG